MTQLMLKLHVACRTRALPVQQRLTDERGEGVISTAIVVLVMALLGAAMWIAFQGMFDGAAGRTGNAVNSIGG